MLALNTCVAVRWNLKYVATTNMLFRKSTSQETFFLYISPASHSLLNWADFYGCVT